MFEKRKLVGLFDGVAWEMSTEEQEELNDHLNSSQNPREAFAKLINCELSFESESTTNAQENEVFSKEYLEEKYVNIVIQINGKKKSLIKVEKNLNEKVLLENVKKDKKISNFLEKKRVFKHIIVKNKLVNLIVK